MYERFTDRARKVMQLANQEAQRFNHEYIGTEHILLGLVKEGSGVAANVLKNLDIDLRKIRLEVEKIVQHLKLQGVPEYLDSITEEDDEDEGAGPAGTSNLEDSDDPYDQAVAVVLRDKKASTSYIQRRLGIGYNRAASIIERMEQEGLVGPANHAGKREILVPTQDDEF